jgi:hypothetical protein
MTYREAVLQLADRARQALPLHASRIDKAVTLVLNGHVEVVEGKYRIASQQDGKTVYHLANGSCTCQDFTSGKAQGWCKHRLAGNIYRKALDMIKTQEPVATHNEAPCSVNTRLILSGREIQLTLRDTSESRLLARLAEVLTQFPINTPSAPAHDETVCPIHHVPMKQWNGKYGLFHSHKTAQGWCQGKGR